MDFYSKSFYLMYIFNYIVVGSSELEFHAMALGHSGLLLYWDSTTVDHKNYKYYIEYKALTSKQGASYQAELISDYIDFARGQRKLHSLNEDTQYEVTIVELGWNDIIKKNYTIKCKTDLKNNSPPEKPYFTWEAKKLFHPTNRKNKISSILWMPCGKERNCHGNEPGTHFAVKYKILDFRGADTIIENFNDYQEAPGLYAGKMYEITVISINGNSETSSDPQEVFFNPISSPVHSVRVLTLSNTSIYVSWEEPKQFIEKISGYFLSYTSKSRDKMIALRMGKDNFTDVQLYDGLPFVVRRVRLNNLKPNIVNTFTIVPYSETDKPGFEYRFDYSIRANETHLPLVKPDFKFERDINTNCYWCVFWIPCPEISDCKNMSFGSDCEIKVQASNDASVGTYNCTEEIWNFISFEENRTYKFIGKSVNEFNQTSDSVSKEISCTQSKLNIREIN